MTTCPECGTRAVRDEGEGESEGESEGEAVPPGLPRPGSVAAIALARQLDPEAYRVVDAVQYWSPQGSVGTFPFHLVRASNAYWGREDQQWMARRIARETARRALADETCRRLGVSIETGEDAATHLEDVSRGGR